MRPSGKAATVLGPRVKPEDDRRLTGRRVRLRQSPPRGMSASAWPVAREVPAGWCTNPTGTLARGMQPWSFPTLALIPAVFVAPLSGCSRQRGRLVCVPLRHVLPIRVSRFWEPSDPITLVKPFVRRETVAAGRGFVPATARHPGAGPASPDIASSGVSEGGTGMSVRGWKWAGMKKSCDVDFVGGFSEVVPLRLRELRGFGGLRGLSPPLRGRKRNRGIGPIRAKPQISQEGGSVR
jgi:hypothetical protein